MDLDKQNKEWNISHDDISTAADKWKSKYLLAHQRHCRILIEMGEKEF